MTNTSNANIEKFSRMYYPTDGKDAFFSLINGSYETGKDGKETFVRGPAADVVDLMVSVASDGKTFKSAEDRAQSYQNIFKKMTADPAKTKTLMNIAHYYYIGKKAGELQKMSYEKGKNVAMQNQQRVNKTIKTRPASYSQPVTSPDDENMPSMMRTIMNGMGR